MLGHKHFSDQCYHHLKSENPIGISTGEVCFIMYAPLQHRISKSFISPEGESICSKNFLGVCGSVGLSVCLLICQSRPNGWRLTPHMGYHRITNFMKNVLGIIFCLAGWLAGCLEIFAFSGRNFGPAGPLQWTPKGSLASKNNI